MTLEYHGDGLGPEIAPWRKKAKKHDRARCNHEYSEWQSRNSYWPHSTERKIAERPDGFSRTRKTKWESETRYCIKCKRREHRTRYIYTYTHYHWDKIIYQYTTTEPWKAY